MRVITDYKQRSEEWHEAKWALVSGSRVKELMVNKPPEETAMFFKMLQEVNEDFNMEDVEEYISKAVQRGNDREPWAVGDLEKWLIAEGIKKEGFEFKEVGIVLSDEYDMLGLSPDRLTEEYNEACEVKCPAGNTHAKWIYDKEMIPLEHVWQAVTYFAVMPELEVLWWASFRKEHKKMPLYIIKVTHETIVNIGTPKRPVTMAIEEAVSVLISKYELLVKLLNEQS